MEMVVNKREEVESGPAVVVNGPKKVVESGPVEVVESGPEEVGSALVLRVTPNAVVVEETRLEMQVLETVAVLEGSMAPGMVLEPVSPEKTTRIWSDRNRPGGSPPGHTSSRISVLVYPPGNCSCLRPPPWTPSTSARTPPPRP